MSRFAAVWAFAFLLVRVCAGTPESTPRDAALVHGELIPETVYVGDTARFRYVFPAARDAPGAGEITLNPEDAAAPDMDVRKAALTRDGDAFILDVTFVPWRPGEFDIPPLDVPFTEDRFIIDPPPFFVASLAETLGEKEPRPPVPPLILPGTTWVLFVLSAAVPAVLAAWVILRKNSRVRALVGALFRSPEARAALRGLKKLKKRAPRMTDREWAQEAALLARDYLERACRGPFRSFTPEEAACALGTDPRGGSFAPLAAEVLARCDLVRFAPSPLPAEERLALGETIRSLVTGIEREAPRA
ncbi:MAG: hypothetical protein LBR23_00770 [Spirochaetaceae bacterium]|jgi:hypothetical protein|nr:hypothetical protein [Spirochaetaceae bacterium]